MFGNHCKILSQQVKGRTDQEWATPDGIQQAIEDAIDSGAFVLSNSRIRAAPSQIIDDAIDNAYNAGRIVVFASGNNNTLIEEPGDRSTCLCVGASDSLDMRWYSSNLGPELDVVAPSGRSGAQNGWFWTTDIPGRTGYNDGGQACLGSDYDYTCKFGGTSAACPQVAALAVMIMHRRSSFVGHPDSVFRVIRYSAERSIYGRPPDDTARVNDSVVWGRINASRAMLAITRGDADNSGSISVADANYMVNYVFGGGPAPIPEPLTGDADCSASLSIADAVYLINYIFANGPAPQVCFFY